MRKTSMLFAIMAGLVLAGGTALAEPDAGAAPAAENQPLAACGVGIAALQEVAGRGIITTSQSSEGAEYLLKQAAGAVGHPVTADEALAARDALGASAGSTPAKKASRITFIDIMIVIAIIIGVVCFFILFGRAVISLLELFAEIPAVVYEVLLFAIAVGVFIWPLAGHMGNGMAPYMGLVACLLLGAGLLFTFKAHDVKFTGVRFSLPLFIAWSVAAVVFHSSLIGFFAMAALMSALGFSAFMVPGCVAIGFDDDAAVARATSAAFAVLIAFVAIHAFGATLPYVGVFKIGALYFGSFVGYLGLLVVSSKWYVRGHGNYILLQVVTVVAGFAALLFGTSLGLPELQKIGGTFFAVYALEKTFEIPKRSLVAWAAFGLVVAVAVYAFCWFVKAHPDTFRPYLFLV